MVLKNRLRSNLNRLLLFWGRLFRRVMKDDLTGMASELAFQVLISLIPVTVVIISFLSLNNAPGEVNFITDLIGNLLPKEVFQPLDKSIESLVRRKERGIFTIGLLISILGSYSLFYTVHKLDGEIHQKPQGKILQTFFYSFRLLFTVAFTLLILINLAFYFLKFDTYLMKTFRFVWLHNQLKSIAPFYVTFSLITLSGATYMFSAHKRRRIAEVIPGALLVGLIWLPVSHGFQYYVKFRTPGEEFKFVYFLLAQMMIMLLWLYINAYIFLLGYSLNSAVTQENSKLN